MLSPVKIFQKSSFWQENYLILRELKSFKATVFVALVFTLLSAIFEGLSIGFILTFLQSLTDPNSEPLQTGINFVDNYFLGVSLPTTERIYRISFVLLIVTMLQAVFTFLGTAYSGIGQSRLVLQLQRRIFSQLQALSLSYFTKTRSGDLVNSITAEITELKSVFETVTFMFVRGTILAVYGLSALLISWQLTAVIIMIFIFISVLISKLFALIREVSFEMTKARSAYTSMAIEYIGGVRTVQVSAAQDFEQARIDASALRVFKADSRSWKIRGIIEPVPDVIVTLVALGVLLFSFTVLIPNGNLGIASLLTFLFVIIRTLPLVRQLNNARGKINKYQGAVRATKALLSTQDKPFFQNGYKPFTGLSKSIDFESVTFCYDSGKPALQNINLTIKRGQMTALVGSSGAGKTTLADLIPRFYDPSSGRILADGVDLRELDVNSLRKKMAVVSQDTFIFNTTVRENIAYSLNDADEKRIVEAAKMANAWKFIQALPKGLDTHLGDRGVLLSGGQRQRIAIARALLRDPEILILDEATSALDSITERLIQESVETLSVGRTVIAVAHRLSTISKADKIVVIEAGEIVEQGTYNSLLNAKGHFWMYHKLQK